MTFPQAKTSVTAKSAFGSDDLGKETRYQLDSNRDAPLTLAMDEMRRKLNKHAIWAIPGIIIGTLFVYLETEDLVVTIIAGLFFIPLTAWAIVEIDRSDQHDLDRATRVADELSMTLSPDDAPEIPVYSSLRHGKSKLLMTGKRDEFSVALFEYHCEPLTRRAFTITEKTTVLMLHSASLHLPNFRCRPRTEGGGEWFGDGPGIESGNDAFREKFYVHGAQEKDIAKLLTNELTSFMARQPALTLECTGDTLLLFERGELLKEGHAKRLADGVEVAGIIQWASQRHHG